MPTCHMDLPCDTMPDRPQFKRNIVKLQILPKKTQRLLVIAEYYIDTDPG